MDQEPEEFPCNSCPMRKHCGAHHMVCSQYMGYFYGRTDWAKLTRDDYSRVNWHRITSDLNVHHCFSVIAQVRRDARKAGRKPTMQEMQDALGLDRETIDELLAKYRAKQGMTGTITQDEKNPGL